MEETSRGTSLSLAAKVATEALVRWWLMLWICCAMVVPLRGHCRSGDWRHTYTVPKAVMIYNDRVTVFLYAVIDDSPSVLDTMPGSGTSTQVRKACFRLCEYKIHKPCCFFIHSFSCPLRCVIVMLDA